MKMIENEKPPVEGDKKLLALRNDKKYERFNHDEAGATAAVEFLQKEPRPGGAVYRLDFYEDKHGDIVPRSTKVGEM